MFATKQQYYIIYISIRTFFKIKKKKYIYTLLLSGGEIKMCKMDKEQIMYVLESCLLATEGCDFYQIYAIYGIPEELSQIGVYIFEYLKWVEP